MRQSFLYGVGILTLVLYVALPVSVFAASANVSHSYKSNSAIQDGSIVSLSKNNTGYIELANSTNGQRLLGVTLPSSQSLIAVDPGQANVQVAISGTVNVLVSTVNGDIKVGDQITVSPFSGIGMDASSGSYVVGVAQGAFSSSSSGAGVEKVKDINGIEKTIYLGLIKLSLAVGTNGTAAGGGQQVNALQKYIKSLTGKTIPTIRIIIAILIMLFSFVTIVTLVYTAVYGSIISIGRNPLAKWAVYRTLIAMMMAVLVIVSLSSISIYLLLN